MARQTRRDYDKFFNRELSFLAFARRVMEMVNDPDVPLLERVKFAGIVGMLHDEFSMKRLSGLKRQIQRRKLKRSLDGRTPTQEFDACRKELLAQAKALAHAVNDSLRPALDEAGIPIVEHGSLGKKDVEHLREWFRRAVLPILTPLAVDTEHPFPFISNLGLNLAIYLPEDKDGNERFVRVKVPNNRPRWVPLPDDRGFVPLEQIIAANLDLLFPRTPPLRVHTFRVTRGASGDPPSTLDELTIEEALNEPGSIVQQVSGELKARRFAGAIRLQVSVDMPKATARWLAEQLELDREDIYPTEYFLGLSDLRDFDVPDRKELRYPPHTPRVHPRLRTTSLTDPDTVFGEIAKGDILVQHPYQSFDASVLQFLRAATLDPDVLAIKLTIYRTSRNSPIVRTLAEAARRGKQVAVLVEITARFDEAPNIQWGEYLEKEGVHVAYGVESLKTHVKLALVVREEKGSVRRYLHVGTGNYHSGTARIYEDMGLLTCDEALCEEASELFNELTGSTTYDYEHLLVAPHNMRERFVELIRREAAHARDGKPSGIQAKMNQLQDPTIIRELYEASQAGVPITVNVRGLCCLRPGVEGLSENIRIYGVVSRFLEHSRVYRFENAGSPRYFIGSSDWMARNLNNRMECIAPIRDPKLQAEIDEIFDLYERDNCSVWDCQPDGSYVRRQVPDGASRWCVQETLIAREDGEVPRPRAKSKVRTA